MDKLWLFSSAFSSLGFSVLTKLKYSYMHYLFSDEAENVLKSTRNMPPKTYQLFPGKFRTV